MRQVSMRPGHLLTVARVALSASIFASAALVVDYQRPGDPAFCGIDSSCMKVRRSDLGLEMSEWIADHVARGLTLPHVALFLFLSVMAGTFFLRTKLHAYGMAVVSGLGALFAAFLIYAQQSIGVYCAYCMAVDVSMIVAAVATIALAVVVARAPKDLYSDLDSLDRATDTPTTLSWGVAIIVLTSLPFIWSKYPVVPPNPPVPSAFEALAEPGKTLVVTFTDFQCPHCRKLHAETKDAMHRPDVKLHRFMVPLAFHPGAMPAALGYMCTPPDKQDAVAHELYTVPEEELTYDGVIAILERVGVDERAKLIDCFQSEETKKKIDADSKLFDEVGAQGLPTTWVGATMTVGAQSAVVIDLLNRTAAPPPVQLPVWLMFAAAGLVVAGCVVWSERRAARTPEPHVPRDETDDTTKSETPPKAGEDDA